MQQLTSFATDYARYVLKGGKQFYTWMGVLSAFILAMLYVFYLQNTDGLIVTGMTSQISDGLYLANLVFLVGVAAGAVTIVFPAYVYHHEGMHKVAVLGEMLAISAVIMVMVFVFAHMGRPDRLWHMIPPWGIYSFSSMLGWDVLVLTGYLILNIVCGFYYLWCKYTGNPINKRSAWMTRRSCTTKPSTTGNPGSPKWGQPDPSSPGATTFPTRARCCRQRFWVLASVLRPKGWRINTWRKDGLSNRSAHPLAESHRSAFRPGPGIFIGRLFGHCGTGSWKSAINHDPGFQLLNDC